MELLNVIQEISQNTANNTDSIKIHFGVVTSAKPLRIKIDNKFELGETFLILTNDVKDYETEFSTGPHTDTGEDTLTVQKKKVEIHNGLKKGESVVLLKLPNGKKYIVLTRV